jgi:hypothetical protein
MTNQGKSERSEIIPGVVLTSAFLKGVAALDIRSLAGDAAI